MRQFQESSLLPIFSRGDAERRSQSENMIAEIIQIEKNYSNDIESGRKYGKGSTDRERSQGAARRRKNGETLLECSKDGRNGGGEIGRSLWKSRNREGTLVNSVFS